MSTASQIAAYLDDTLKVEEFEDASHNGLQVESRGQVCKICCGVDASLEFFKVARQREADMLICHHGISWGDSLSRITGLNYQRVSFLMRYNMALYACHLPLDAHPRLGNNAQICRALELSALKPFGDYHGKPIGYAGRLPRPVRYETFKNRLARAVNADLRTMDFGKKQVRRVGVVSGGAAELVAEAGQSGLDVFVSGEPKLEAYALAQEYGVNAVFAGHYATEVFGVRALARALARRFKVKAEFIDLNVPW